MDANNTCQAQAVTGSQAEQVVWTTILFNLLTFGLNTMSQPAGAVCGGASNLGFMLRSSPIICLIDTCYMLCRFVQLYFQPKQTTTTTLAPQLTRKDRLRQAHIRLLRLRYQPWDAAKEDTDDLIQQNLQSNKTFRFLAFVLLIVQAIKFFAYEGLYWSKAIAGLYLFAYMTVELLTIWPRGEEFTQAITAEREDPIASSGALSLAYFSVALAVAFMSFLGAAFIKDATNGSHESLPQHLGTASFSSWALALLFAYGMCGRQQVLAQTVGTNAAAGAYAWNSLGLLRFRASNGCWDRQADHRTSAVGGVGDCVGGCGSQICFCCDQNDSRQGWEG